jgi:hypothetical protein
MHIDIDTVRRRKHGFVLGVVLRRVHRGSGVLATLLVVALAVALFFARTSSDSIDGSLRFA